MRIIVFANLKGGVGKTFSAINTALILSELHSKKVLIVDNDPQGNTSKFFSVHDYDKSSIEDILSGNKTAAEVIRCIKENLDVLPSNGNLDIACRDLIKSDDAEQNTILRNALSSVSTKYDYCVIDCQPGMNLNTINAMCCANDIIIPVNTEQESIDGLEEIGYFIEEARDFNPDIELVKGLITMYVKDDVSKADEEKIRKSEYGAFQTVIRSSVRVAKRWSHEKCISICSFSPRCSASFDYKEFVQEYLDLVKDGE
ncbi:MAG: ParA family protein [Clostridium sp.]|nr:ParA family protein [Clostridium sp.]